MPGYGIVTDVMVKWMGLHIRNTLFLVVLAVLYPTFLLAETSTKPADSNTISVKIEITEAVWEDGADVFTEAYGFYSYVNEELEDSLSTGINNIPSNSDATNDSLETNKHAVSLLPGKRKQTLSHTLHHADFSLSHYNSNFPQPNLVAFVSHKFLRYLALRLNSPPPSEQKTGVL